MEIENLIKLVKMSEEQKRLVSVLDSVHNTLRVRKRQTEGNEVEWNKMWEEHTSDLKTLKVNFAIYLITRSQIFNRLGR